MPQDKEKTKEVIEDSTHPRQRTPAQNSALWLFFTRLATQLNDAGMDMRKVLKPTYNIPWTKENIHDHIWIPFQKAMYGTNSTTFLHKQEQIDKLHETIMRELGEKHSVEYIPFPTSEVDKETAPLKENPNKPKIITKENGERVAVI